MVQIMEQNVFFHSSTIIQNTTGASQKQIPSFPSRQNLGAQQRYSYLYKSNEERVLFYHALYQAIILICNVPQVDQSGVHVSGKGKWGHCSSKCPLSESEEPDELEEHIFPCTLPNGNKGSCQPYGICGGFGLEDREEEAFVFDQNGRSVFENECEQEDGKTRILTRQV